MQLMKYFVEPHIRYYAQTAADFYHSYLKLGDGIELDTQGETCSDHYNMHQRIADLGAFECNNLRC